MTGAARHKIVGVCPAARGAVLAETMRTHPSPVWVVVAPDLRLAEQLAEDTGFFWAAQGSCPPIETLVFPESMPDSRDMREVFTASGERLTVLSRLREARSARPAGAPVLAVFATPTSLL
jgi:transcription-repair coupling factor (superfamily II helicase)